MSLLFSRRSSRNVIRRGPSDAPRLQLPTTWPSIIAVILNYVKRSEANGTWLETHFRWQIRTFWYGLLWVCLCALFVLLTLGIGILIAWLPLGVVGIWFVYRILRGWLALRESRPMYV